MLPLFIFLEEKKAKEKKEKGFFLSSLLGMFLICQPFLKWKKKLKLKTKQTPENLKTPTGEEAFNPDGLVQRAIRLLKAEFPDLEVYTDVALDPYNCDGHDGIVADDGEVLNDETVEFLCRQAVSQARAGADCVAPSDMMDGRVGAIRDALDDAGFTNVRFYYAFFPFFSFSEVGVEKKVEKKFQKK